MADIVPAKRQWSNDKVVRRRRSAGVAVEQARYRVDRDVHERMRSIYLKLKDGEDVNDAEIEAAELALWACLGAVHSSYIAVRVAPGLNGIRKSRLERMRVALSERALRLREQELERDTRISEMQANINAMNEKLAKIAERSKSDVGSVNDL